MQTSTTATGRCPAGGQVAGRVGPSCPGNSTGPGLDRWVVGRHRSNRSRLAAGAGVALAAAGWVSVGDEAAAQLRAGRRRADGLDCGASLGGPGGQSSPAAGVCGAQAARIEVAATRLPVTDAIRRSASRRVMRPS